MANLTCIEQRINIGKQFDGTLPTTTPADVAGVRIFPIDDAGGLFNFFPVATALPNAEDRNLKILRIDTDMAGLDAADTFYFRKVSANGDVIFFADGPGDYVWTPDGPDGLILAPDETLNLYTGINAVAALFCRIVAEPEHAHWNRR